MLLMFWFYLLVFIMLFLCAVAKAPVSALEDRKYVVLRSLGKQPGHLRIGTETEQTSGAAETGPVKQSKKM